MIGRMSHMIGRGIVIAIVMVCNFTGMPLASGVQKDGNLYLIFSGPLTNGSPNIPNRAIIYRFDESAKTMEKIWMTEPDSINHWIQVWEVRIYGGNGPVIISEGDLFPVKQHIFYPANISKPIYVELPPYVSPLGYKYYACKTGVDYLEVPYSREDPKVKLTNDVEWIRLDTVSWKAEYGEKSTCADVRLTGIGIPRSDAISYRMDADGIFSGIYTVAPTDWATNPINIIRLKTVKDWVMVANEPTYCALISIPDRHEIIQTEVLVYRREDSTWSSLFVPGSETSLRMVSGWLTGIVGYTDPKTVFGSFRGYPTVYKDTLAFVQPEQKRVITSFLGKHAWVLWIEDDVVYYRVDTSLYRARMEGNDLVDRTLILSDPRLRGVNWAFRGSEGGK